MKQYWKGFITAFIILGIIGSLTAVGFHSADEILGGTFSQNYEFSGHVNFSGTTSGISSGGIPSGMIAKFNTSVCPIGWTSTLGGQPINVDLTSGGVATEDSFHTTNTGDKAFDNDLGTIWGAADGGTPNWVQYTFPSQVNINKVKINPNLDTVGSGWGGVKTFRVEYYNGASWVDASGDLSCPQVTNSIQEYIFSTEALSTQWRIYITEAWISGNRWASILEAEMIATELKCIKD